MPAQEIFKGDCEMEDGRMKMIKISYDDKGDVLEIRFSESKIIESEYIEKSGLVIDYGKNNSIVAIEMLAYSKKTSREELVKA